MAALGLILVTAVADPGRDEPEALGEAVETQIAALVEGGTDEAALRRLVGDAVDLGRARPIR